MKERINLPNCLFVLIFCFIVIFIGNNESVAKKGDLDITRLASAVERQNGSIIEWSLHTRELVELSSWKGTERKFLKHSGWVYDTTGGVVTATFSHGDVHEKIQWIQKEGKNRSVTYMSYEITGTKWNKKIAGQAERLLEKRMKQLYGHKTFVFSCIKGIFNVSYEEFDRTIIRELLHTLLATEIEALREEGFYSISAYSSLFTHTLSLNNQKMNLQISLREQKSGQGTFFTLGTPILTNEY